MILFTSTLSDNSIITAYREGVVKTTITRDSNQNLHTERELIPINSFDEANSMDFKGISITLNQMIIYYMQRILSKRPFLFLKQITNLIVI